MAQIVRHRYCDTTSDVLAGLDGLRDVGDTGKRIPLVASIDELSCLTANATKPQKPTITLR